MTIEEALSAIKNAVYGKDVRQAMHDGILQAEGGAGTVAKEAEKSAKKAAESSKKSEIASKAIEGKADQAVTIAKSANSKSDSTQLQLDEIVINGDSSVEAAQARVDIKNISYATLKDRLDKEQQEVNAQLARIEITPEQFGAVGDGVTDDSEAINNAFSQLSGKRLKFDTDKTYAFTKKIIVDGAKNFTVDFNGSVLLDKGSSLPVVGGGTATNPVGIKFVNCDYFETKGMISDTDVSTLSTRIAHENADLKSATVEYELCKNFSVERPVFQGSQGSNPLSGYPYHMTLSEALNFSHIKFYECKNITLVGFLLENSETSNEVIQFGECDGVRITSSEISELANNVSWGKFIKCTNLTFEESTYSSEKSTSFIDVSGDNINIENVILDYPNGKLLDLTNEWGEIGGEVKNVSIKNVRAIVDQGVFVSKMAMDWAPEGLVEYISPVDSIRVNDSVFGDKTKDGNTGGSFINTANRIIEIEVTNSKIYNMSRFMSGTITRPEELFKNTSRKFNNCEFVNNSTTGSIRPFNSTGKNTFDNCYFYNRGFGDVLSFGDEHAAYEGSIERSDTKYIFNKCTFENINLKMEANIIFNNCTFINCNFKNDAMKNTVQEFKNCELKWNSEHLVFSGYASQSLFQLMESKKVVFTNCTFIGNPKYDSGLMFDIVYPKQNHVYEFYNCLFDLDRFGASGNNIVVSLERPANTNVTSHYFFSECKFRGKTIPSRIVGGSRTNDATRRLTLVHCYSDQTAYEQSLYAINIGDGQALSSFELILLNNTFSNSENILSINHDFFGKIIEKNNTGVSF